MTTAKIEAGAKLLEALELKADEFANMSQEI